MTEDESLPPLARRVVLGFLATLFVYITVYGGCQAMRRRGGPWAVTFAETNGVRERPQEPAPSRSSASSTAWPA
ncbi:MAG: hypothetical protein ACKO3N_13415, partial [Verrucomicrobiota bacterium]